MSRQSVWIWAGLMGCVLLIGGVGGPASRPAGVGAALAGLADPDPAVREKARDQLMGLGRQQLPDLREAIRKAAPLHPAQLAAIKEIVTHVYLSGEPYEKSPEGFLGIRMLRLVDPSQKVDVVVETRFPGFAGSRYLMEGDIILDIEERALPQPLDQAAFTQAIRELGARRTIHVKLIRHGQVMRVVVKLDARPAFGMADELTAMDQLVASREQAAERYWKVEIAPLIERAAEQE